MEILLEQGTRPGNEGLSSLPHERIGMLDPHLSEEPLCRENEPLEERERPGRLPFQGSTILRFQGIEGSEERLLGWL